MQRGNYPSNHRFQSPPYAPRAPPFSPYSPDFLQPRGPCQWQPSVRYSTPRPCRPGDFSNSSPASFVGNSPNGSNYSPRGSDNSDPYYIPLNSSQESSPAGHWGNGWTPKWRNHDNYSPSPRDRYQQDPGFGRSRGRRGNKMNSSSPQGWQSQPKHATNIKDYISPRMLQDPWAELVSKLKKPNKAKD